MLLKLVFCIPLLFFPVSGRPLLLDEAIDKINSDSENRQDNLNAIPHELEGLLISHYRKEFDSKDRDLRRRSAEVLLSLNDSQTIERFLSTYYQKSKESNEAQGFLMSFSRESVIPYLYRDVHERMPLYGHRYEDFHITAHRIIFWTVANSRLFPQKTRDWAQFCHRRCATLTPFPQDPIYRQLKEWLYHNRMAILEERYQDAIWLPAKYPQPYQLKTIPPPPAPPPPDSELLEMPQPTVTKLVKSLPKSEVESGGIAKLILESDLPSYEVRESKKGPVRNTLADQAAAEEAGFWDIFLLFVLVAFTMIVTLLLWLFRGRETIV